MKVRARRTLTNSWCFATGVTLLALASCTGALVTSQPLVDTDSSYYWERVINEVPVQVHGSVPGHTESELMVLLTAKPEPAMTVPTDDASGWPAVRSDEDPRRVVFFLNPLTYPLPLRICRNEATPWSGPQTGDRAQVYVVLCNGREPIAETQGTLPAIGQTDEDIKNSYATIEDSLIEAIRAIDPTLKGLGR
jgi:hypothetical protein